MTQNVIGPVLVYTNLSLLICTRTVLYLDYFCPVNAGCGINTLLRLFSIDLEETKDVFERRQCSTGQQLCIGEVATQNS